jgi:hypothetical protein
MNSSTRALTRDWIPVTMSGLGAGVNLCTNWQFALVHDPNIWYHRQGFLFIGTRARKRGPNSWAITSRVFQRCPEVRDSGSCLVDQGAESGHHRGSLGQGRGAYCCLFIWFLAFAGQGPSFQEVPLDPGWIVGVVCRRADLEEHGMIQGEDICSEFIIGCNIQGGSSG